MTEYVYLIRNGSLYNIGKTKNLELIKKKLSPGTIQAALQTDEAESILKILRNKYADKLLPDSDYFRLTEKDSNDCKRQLEEGGTQKDFKPFFSGIRLFISFIIAWTSLSLLIIKFGIQPIFDKFS